MSAAAASAPVRVYNPLDPHALPLPSLHAHEDDKDVAAAADNDVAADVASAKAHAERRLAAFLAHAFEPSRTYYHHASTQRSVEYIPGTLPWIITVPHGGHVWSEIGDADEGDGDGDPDRNLARDVRFVDPRTSPTAMHVLTTTAVTATSDSFPDVLEPPPKPPLNTCNSCCGRCCGTNSSSCPCAVASAVAPASAPTTASSPASPSPSSLAPLSRIRIARTCTLPERTTGCREKDLFTQELARAVRAAIRAHTQRVFGVPLDAHMIVSRMHRKHIDMNRSRDDCSESEDARRVWDVYHACVLRAKLAIASGAHARGGARVDEDDGTHGASACAPLANDDRGHADDASRAARSLLGASLAELLGGRVTVSRVGHGLLLDLHGQAHDARCQLGYVLTKAELEAGSGERENIIADATASSTRIDPFPPSAWADRCSLNSWLARSHVHALTLESLVRGAPSFGAFLEASGHACVPSPSSPTPGPNVLYFNGGYTTAWHGSSMLGLRSKAERLTHVLQRLARTSTVAPSAAQQQSQQPQQPQSQPSSHSSTLPTHSAALLASWLHRELALGDRISAIQLESAFTGIRDSFSHRVQFGRALCSALWRFWLVHCGATSFDR